MTPKQGLWAHIRELHSPRNHPPARATLAQLQRWHAEQHHRYSPNHYHTGVNLGPSARPPGWYTGQDAVQKQVAALRERKGS
jgi:hypothetical protein